MGKADVVNWDGDNAVMVWDAGSATYCGVKFDPAGKVNDKRCDVDEAERANGFWRRLGQGIANSARERDAREAAAPRTTYQPTAYQSRQPVRTSCTSSQMGNSVNTDCTSRPSGPDLSIYDNVYRAN